MRLPGPKTRLVVLAVVAVAAALRADQHYRTRLFDLYPLYYGGLAWLETGNAYLLDTVVPAADRGHQLFEIGNVYPLPAVLVTLPLTLLQPQVAGIIWVAFLVAGLIAALRLYGARTGSCSTSRSSRRCGSSSTPHSS